MGSPSVREDQVHPGTHLSDQKDVQRVVRADAKRSRLLVLVAIDANEFQGKCPAHVEIHLPLYEKADCNVCLQDLSGWVRQGLIRIVESPQSGLARRVVDGY